MPIHIKHLWRGNSWLGALLAVAFLDILSSSWPTLAGGPDLNGCARLVKKNVIGVLDEKMSSVAKLSMETREFAIHVNPFRYNLGAETVRWLYFRQCALIGIVGDDIGRRSPSPEEDQKADCKAIPLMRLEHELGPYDLLSIQRDLEAMDASQWEINLGPRRSIDLESCLKAGD